jgi:hypothetical protein
MPVLAGLETASTGLIEVELPSISIISPLSEARSSDPGPADQILYAAALAKRA